VHQNLNSTFTTVVKQIK